MKAKERRHLKENEFVVTTQRVMLWAQENRDRLTIGGIVLAVVVAIGGGYWYWRQHTNDQADALLGAAMAIEQATIAPAPTVPGAAQTPGTYPSEKARSEAEIAAFQKVVTTYPSTPAALTARYEMAGALMAVGRLADAEQAYRAEISAAGASVYGPMAHLGLAQALLSEGKYDDAIKEYTDLAAARDSMVPVDGVLMQLGHAYVKAGKTADARAAFKRVVDEFPDSGYVTEAKQQLTDLG
jgi:TolA-binding protein